MIAARSTVAIAGFALVVCACSDGLRDDVYRCTVGGPSSQCPTDWVCRPSARDGVSRCFEHAGTPTTLDAALDAQRDAARRDDAAAPDEDAATPDEDSGEATDAGPDDDAAPIDAALMDATPIDDAGPDETDADADGADADRTDASTGTPRPVHLALGEWHSCALYDDGSVWCWGSSSEGQLGFIGESDWGALLVPDIPPIVHLACGDRNACGVTREGNVWCWGANFYGQTDPTSRDNPVLPTEVAMVSGVAEVALGNPHACARLESGGVRCWGGQRFGVLGPVPADMAVRVAPLDIPGIAGAVEIAAGDNHVCARLGDDSVRCWGLNQSAQLGSGTDDPASGLVTPMGIGSVSALGLGGAHTCVRIGGTATCWGDNVEGQIGLEASGIEVTMPTAVMGVTGIEGLALGGSHTCVRRAADTVCWGNNSSHQTRAAGSTSDTWHVPEISSDVPAATPTDPRYDTVAAGDDHTCAILESGGIVCWGNNLLGQLGDSVGSSSADLVAVPGLP